MAKDKKSVPYPVRNGHQRTRYAHTSTNQKATNRRKKALQRLLEQRNNTVDLVKIARIDREINSINQKI